MMRDLTGTRQTEVFGLSLSPAQVLGAQASSPADCDLVNASGHQAGEHACGPSPQCPGHHSTGRNRLHFLVITINLI
jgi:hypothetical protein